MEPFLKNVDLLARMDELNLVDPRDPPTRGGLCNPLDWKVASQLRQAAMMLRFERGLVSGDHAAVDCIDQCQRGPFAGRVF